MKTSSILFFIYLIHHAHLESTTSTTDPSFKALPLCDTAILVTWKPTTSETHHQIRYTFAYQEIRETQLGPELKAGRTADSTEGQVKLNDLKENTKYRIIIYEETKDKPSIQYFIESETRKIDFSEPAKPEFDYKIYTEKFWNSNVKIRWLPCGRQHNCHGEAPGCNFFVKYRIKGAENFQKVSEYYEDYVYLRDCLPGKVYEFIVVSNNLPSESESDIREIVVPPEADPVRNFNALLLGSFRVLLTWEPPNQLKGNLTGYKIFYEDKAFPYKFIHRDQYDKIASNCTRAILSYLQPNTAYRISIAARTDIGLGAVKTIDVHTNKHKISTKPPYKPQALYNVTDGFLDMSQLKITWLPCGVEKNCHNQNAGSYFKVKYKFENESNYCELSEFDQDFIIIEYLLPNVIYDFIVVSVDEMYQTESDAHKIVIPDSGQRIYETVEGSNFTLPCNPSDKPEIRTKWLKNDFELPSRKFIKQPNGDLQIRNVTLKDSGKYVCTIPSSPVSINDIAFLSVKKKTHVHLATGKSKHRELHAGEKFDLRCEADTDSSLSIYSYKWFKNENSIDFGANNLIIRTQANMLTFLNATVADTANYTCVASTRLDSGSNRVEIVVLNL